MEIIALTIFSFYFFLYFPVFRCCCCCVSLLIAPFAVTIAEKDFCCGVSFSFEGLGHGWFAVVIVVVGVAVVAGDVLCVCVWLA